MSHACFIPASPSSSKIVYRILLHMIKRHKVQEPWVSICLPLTSRFCGLESNHQLPPWDLNTVEGASSLLKWSFRRGNELAKSAEDRNEALDRAFDALFAFNTLLLLKQRREQHIDRTMIKYSLGSVIRHRTYGYRGVIFGWDRTCQQSPEWMKKMGVHELKYGADQPFYYVQPENFALSESESFFKYVAEENISELKEAHLHITTVSRFFNRYNVKLGRYTPVSYLKYMFPDEYEDRSSGLIKSSQLKSISETDGSLAQGCGAEPTGTDALKTNNQA